MSSKSYQKKKCASDKDFSKRKVDFNDYLFLKECYTELGEKYKKIKEEHKNSTKALKEYQSQILEFQKAKNAINDMFKQFKEKIGNKINLTNSKKILELEKEINTKNGEIIKVKEVNLDLESKIKMLEEEINKLKDENKNKDKLIEDLKNKGKKLEEDLKQKEDENLLIINKLNELKEEIDKENKVLTENNKNNLFFNNLSIEKNLSVYLISSNNKIEDKTNISNEEKNILITKSRKTETNSSTNHFNKVNINTNTNNFSNNLNEIVLNNYLNTINVGYNGLNENYKIDIDNEENLIENDKALECEPTPSFIVCIKKMNNI